MKRKTRRNTLGMPILGSFVFTAFLLLAATACTPAGDEEGVASDSTFSAVPLPNPDIPGYTFPEPEATIEGWVRTSTSSTSDSSAINLHAWGIWTALTEETNEMFEGQSLLVFETWYTPSDIGTSTSQQTPLEGFQRVPRPLETPNQLRPLTPDEAATTVEGFVKYDPSAATFAYENDLFSADKLNALNADTTAIPNFPSTAVTLKPVFLPGFIDQLELIDGRYYKLPVWPGPPSTPQEWGNDKWPHVVWVDTQDQTDGPGYALADSASTSPADSTTYGLGRFIHFVENDITQILVAMHVTSRETTRWTWQTFWWTPTPDNPHAPSSTSIANDRPAQLQGAPRNYAHCTAYSMLDPQQPYTGGSNTGNPVYCYNPWLEAGFAPVNLPASQPGMYNGMPVSNNFGIQTNCMSCHAQARWPTMADSTRNNPFYTGDRYIDIDGAQFSGALKLDFAWSIQRSAKTH